MNVSSVTVGLPVSDLDRAVSWYRRVLQLAEPDLEPAEGVVEFKVGPAWLQLGADSTARSGAEVVTRFGVDDARRERERLVELGVAVGPLEHVPGAVDYFDFTDPDGNVLSMYSELDG
ncbi:VOC family protein [Pseudonocardia yuanmonensis]|uniref:VOC family protein n=1 Tax=Pseudonocardia yuanmonensis TaxID=1095914 RepID=A0ABP8XEM9_9PSEU